jgi:hypothetical protein
VLLPCCCAAGVSLFGDNPAFQGHPSFATFGLSLVTLTQLAIVDAWEEVRWTRCVCVVGGGGLSLGSEPPMCGAAVLAIQAPL